MMMMSTRSVSFLTLFYYSLLIQNDLFPRPLPFATRNTQQRASRCCVAALLNSRLPPPRRQALLHSFSVPASTIDANLSDDERKVVSVVRNSGPSVACVTSVLAVVGQANNNNNNNNGPTTRRDGLPRGSRSLGTGSGFVVDARGYIVTNYHVVEQCYQLWQGMQRMPSWLLQRQSARMTPQVYVRLNGRYQACSFVQVRPALDVAVLKVIDDATTSTNTTTFPPPLTFGDSTQLLVGQSLIAIGNPFGLEQTVTTGVVSALYRDVPVRNSASILQNCIQTDCSINPGNSGGPLIDQYNGQVVGVNTAIVSTSGSSAGIGLAIPSAAVAPVVREIVRQDSRSASSWLGVSILRQQQAGNNSKLCCRVAKVVPGSPADQAGIRAIRYSNVAVEVEGDAVVAVAGTPVASYTELLDQMERTRPNERLALTVEDVATGERRVVYVTLQKYPETK